MEFGLQFFPDVGPEQKSGEQYWSEALHLVDLVDELGFTNVRTVEHYFHPYGGYSPNPLLFLAAAAMRAKRARLIAGAVLPVFNNPLKLAAEIAMLDAISAGRFEAGFARAFLPHEFSRFGVSVNESWARFEEGVEQVRRLLEEEHVTMEGRFHRFEDVTSLPRPTQRPRPPFWVAALGTLKTFVWAGERGYNIMGVPMAGGAMAELLGTYQEAWRSAGHPGRGKVMLAFHMFCHEDQAQAVEIAKAPLDRYLQSVADAAVGWVGAKSNDYPGYEGIVARYRAETFETQRQKSIAWVGSPAELRDMIGGYIAEVGGFDIASLQVNFNTVSLDHAEASMRLFARSVMNHFTSARRADT